MLERTYGRSDPCKVEECTSSSAEAQTAPRCAMDQPDFARRMWAFRTATRVIYSSSPLLTCFVKSRSKCQEGMYCNK